jgi:hypothetical protein
MALRKLDRQPDEHHAFRTYAHTTVDLRQIQSNTNSGADSNRPTSGTASGWPSRQPPMVYRQLWSI